MEKNKKELAKLALAALLLASSLPVAGHAGEVEVNGTLLAAGCGGGSGSEGCGAVSSSTTTTTTTPGANRQSSTTSNYDKLAALMAALAVTIKP